MSNLDTSSPNNMMAGSKQPRLQKQPPNSQNHLKTRTILDYDSITAVPRGESIEILVDVRKYDSTIIAEYSKRDMTPYTGDIIFVRESLAKKLAAINHNLRQHGYLLNIVYGYRHPAVQEFYFNAQRTKLALVYPALSSTELDRYTHNFVAIPDVAGHPTGGAVDVTITTKSGTKLDMGTIIADFTNPEKIKTFGSGLTKLQKANRKLLHDLMIEQGFAPFYGEWWHYSYGDRE